MFFKAWSEVRGYLDYVFASYILTNKIYANSEIYPQRSALAFAGSALSTSLSWSSMKAQQIRSVETAIQQIETLANALKKNHSVEKDSLSSDTL